MEALAYLKKQKHDDYCFAPNHFTLKEAVKIVKQLYKLKATLVSVDCSQQYDDEFMDTLVIELPKNKSDRLNIAGYLIERIRPDSISKDIKNIKTFDWNIDNKMFCWWE